MDNIRHQINGLDERLEELRRCAMDESLSLVERLEAAAERLERLIERLELLLRLERAEEALRNEESDDG